MKLEDEKLLSSFAFNFKLRPCSVVLCPGIVVPPDPAQPGGVEPRTLPPIECHDGSCTSCGAHKVDAIMDALIEVSPPDTTVTWHSFGYVHDAANVRRLEQIRMGPVSVPEFRTHVMDNFFGKHSKTKPFDRRCRDGFVWHRFEARWQHWMMCDDQQTFPVGTIWVGSDFAQNPVIKNNDEVPGQYFNPKQATLYNAVILYHGVGSTVENRIIIRSTYR